MSAIIVDNGLGRHRESSRAEARDLGTWQSAFPLVGENCRLSFLSLDGRGLPTISPRPGRERIKVRVK